MTPSRDDWVGQVAFHQLDVVHERSNALKLFHTAVTNQAVYLVALAEREFGQV